MKVAVMSDTHDHIEILEHVIANINKQNPDAILHCGDLCSPFVLDRLSQFNGEVHIVFGNNEGDRFRILEVAKKFSSIKLHGELGFIQTENGKVAFTHRPEFARGLASTDDYIAVFYGHTHKKKADQIGNTYLVNPGDLMGLLEPPGWIIFDLTKGTWEHFTVT